jgi:putative ABC transport system substrate-binding protein
MQRREFIKLIGGAAAVAWPLAARAQQPARSLPRIGTIENFQNENFEALIQGLREAGYVDRQNILLETRFYGGVLDRVDEFARELVALKCSVILATAPIFLDIPELGGRQIERLKEAMPTVVRVAVLWDATIGAVQFRGTETAARPSGVTLESFPIHSVEDIKDAIEHAAREQMHGLVVLTSPLIFNQRSQIADLALKSRLPTISIFSSFPRVGGLMAYGPSLASMFKQAGSYVDRILSGANPGELPIQRPSKCEFVVNLKTAKTLGLTIPETLLVRADEVIE